MLRANSKTEAKEVRNQIIKMLQRAGFQLRKWTSNHFELLKDTPHVNDLLKSFIS